MGLITIFVFVVLLAFLHYHAQDFSKEKQKIRYLDFYFANSYFTGIVGLGPGRKPGIKNLPFFLPALTSGFFYVKKPAKRAKNAF